MGDQLEAWLDRGRVTAGEVVSVGWRGGDSRIDTVEVRLVSLERGGLNRATGIDPDPVEFASVLAMKSPVEMAVPHHLGPAMHIDVRYHLDAAVHHEVWVERGRSKVRLPIEVVPAPLGSDASVFEPNLNSPQTTASGSGLGVIGLSILVLAFVVSLGLIAVAVFDDSLSRGTRAFYVSAGVMMLGPSALFLWAQTPSSRREYELMTSTSLSVERPVVAAGQPVVVEVDPGRYGIENLTVRLVAVREAPVSSSESGTSTVRENLIEFDEIPASRLTLVETPVDGPVAHFGRRVKVWWQVELRGRSGCIHSVAVDVRPNSVTG